MPHLDRTVPAVGDGLGDDAGSFFDDPIYLRTVNAESTDAVSTEEALGAARLAACAPGARILDAGCGNGRHAVPLARAGYRVVALDRSAPLLAAARKSAGGGPRPRFVLGSYASLAFDAGEFDAVLSLGTALGYLGDEGDQRALGEFRRVLAPGGRLVIETLHRAALESGLAVHEDRALPAAATLRIDRRFDAWRGILHEAQQLRDGAAWGPARAYDIRVYSRAELESMLTDAGFARLEWYGSLGGTGTPSPMTPLVVVAQVPAS